MAVISMLSLDVQHFLNSLDKPIDDRLIVYHAVFLSPTGRAFLSIRLHSLVRREVNLEDFVWCVDEIHYILENLPYVSSTRGIEETDKMHFIFRCLRQHGQEKKTGAADQNPVQSHNEDEEGNPDSCEQKPREKTGTADQMLVQSHTEDEEKEKAKCRVTSGYSVLGINRNGVMHRVTANVMWKLARAEANKTNNNEPLPAIKKYKKYCLWEIVQLLHFHMPLLLPRAQQLVMEKNLWRHLEMGVLWPRDEIFHHMSPLRIGPTPKLTSMFKYRSNLAAVSQAESCENSNNSTVFIGGLDPTVNQDDLKHICCPYGELLDVKKLNGKKFGFVEFSTRASAKEAIKMLNGQKLGRRPMSLSFARLPAAKKGPILGEHYAHPQTYDNYAWTMSVVERDKKGEKEGEKQGEKVHRLRKRPRKRPRKNT